MEFHFINYSTTLIIVAVVIGVAGLLASSSAPIVAYNNKLFGPVSSSLPSSSDQVVVAFHQGFPVVLATR